MAPLTLKSLVNESWYDESKKLTKEEKRDFANKVANYPKLGEALYSKHNLVEIAKQLAEIAKCAQSFALNEAGEEFDKLTIERNMKELNALSTNFSKVATEAQALKERLTVLYEDAGNVLGRYFSMESSIPDSSELVEPEDSNL